VNIVVRWRIVHPADNGEKISCCSYVLFEEIIDGVRDRIRSCPVEVWPSMRSKIEGDGVVFNQLPDTMEPPRPEGPKKTKR